MVVKIKAGELGCTSKKKHFYTQWNITTFVVGVVVVVIKIGAILLTFKEVGKKILFHL